MVAPFLTIYFTYSHAQYQARHRNRENNLYGTHDLAIMARCLADKESELCFVLALEGGRSLVRWLLCRDCLFLDLGLAKARMGTESEHKDALDSLRTLDKIQVANLPDFHRRQPGMYRHCYRSKHTGCMEGSNLHHKTSTADAVCLTKIQLMQAKTHTRDRVLDSSFQLRF